MWLIISQFKTAQAEGRGGMEGVSPNVTIVIKMERFSKLEKKGTMGEASAEYSCNFFREERHSTNRLAPLYGEMKTKYKLYVQNERRGVLNRVATLLI